MENLPFREDLKPVMSSLRIQGIQGIQNPRLTEIGEPKTTIGHGFPGFETMKIIHENHPGKPTGWRLT